MPTSLIDADSLLAIDVGTIATRAMLFDLVDGRYRFVALGSAPTTAGVPYNDIGEGLRAALDQLSEITGRKLVGNDGRLIVPAQSSTTGVDTCVATLSTGKPLRVVAVGLLEDVSAESAHRLAATTYAEVVEQLSLNDRRKPSARLDAILRSRPDLVIVAGGTDGGASQSVMKLLESIGLACYLLPENQRPELFYVGNQALVPEVEEVLDNLGHLTVGPNVRPALDMEQLSPAQNQLSSIFRTVRSRTIPGVQELDSWTGGRLMPTSTAFGRVVRFLSQVYDPAKGVLGVDIGASSLTLAAAFSGDAYLGIYPDLGLGERVGQLLDSARLEEIVRWIPFEISEDALLEYIYNKALYPAVLPATQEAAAIELAIARQAMAVAVRRLWDSFPKKAARTSPGLLPWFEPIVAAGSVLTNSGHYGQSLLALLDALQPTGISTIVLDQNNIAAALGAAAAINSVLAIQILESNTFLNLGTVISVVSHVQNGAPVLKVRIHYNSGNESVVDVKNGALDVIPLPMGESARMQLQPLNRSDIGMGGPGRGGSVRVVGGALGVIIDARGRPLRLSKDSGKRHELQKKWLWSLGC
jgi:uncharacterized protein (TIGR01319 family)